MAASKRNPTRTHKRPPARHLTPSQHAAVSGGDDPNASTTTTTGDGSGGSGSGDGSGGSSGGSGNIDYSGMFSAFGLTPDMITQINNLFAQYLSSGMDPTNVYDLIIGQIRGGAIGSNYKNGMSWYQYTYQGIQYGMANGLVDSSDPERSYRQYVNTVNQYYEEYFGRDATIDEVTQFMQGGVSSDRVGAQLKGQSYANAYSNADANAMGYSWNAMLGAFGNLPNGEKQLSSDEATAVGESMTGYSTPLGDQLNKQLQTAMRRMQTIFRGTLATPADLQKTGAGLKAPSLAGESTPDTGPI